MTTASLTPPNNPKECDSNIWMMFYRHGMNANLTKCFKWPGDLQEARKRAEKHSKIMGYKFIFIRPLIVDLDKDEEYKLHGAIEGELTP